MTNSKQCHAETPEGGTQYLKCAIYDSAQYITSPALFTLDDIENALQWVCTLRKDYSSNSDIWRLRRDWVQIKHEMLWSGSMTDHTPLGCWIVMSLRMPLFPFGRPKI